MPKQAGAKRTSVQLNFPQHGLSQEQINLAFEAWKKIIDVQQHYNDIEMRIRNLAVTVLVGVIGASGLALTQPTAINVFGFTTTSAAWLLTGGLVSWLAFYIMDRWWYHRELMGAVLQGQNIENILAESIPGISLSNQIREASPFRFLGIGSPIRSSNKIDIFYGSIVVILLIMIYAVR